MSSKLWTHELTRDESWYEHPAQAKEPNGRLPKGTLVRILELGGSYTLVEADTGVRGYVSSGSLKPVSKLSTDSDKKARAWTHELTSDQPWYKNPAQARPPNGILPKGTRVCILAHSGSYSKVLAEDGTTGYVSTGSLRSLVAAHLLRVCKDNLEAAQIEITRASQVVLPSPNEAEKAARALFEAAGRSVQGSLLALRSSWGLRKMDPAVVASEESKDSKESKESKMERIIGSADFLPVHYLHEGVERSKAVCVVVGSATGFLVSKGIIMTNNHVLGSVQEALGATIRFNYQQDFHGRNETPHDWSLDPGSLFHTNPDLDYTIVAVKPRLVSAERLSEFKSLLPGDMFGFIKLDAKVPVPKVGTALNVIGHPSLRRKEIAIRNNVVTKTETPYTHYTTDTEPGNSGSPVFNDSWDIVVLHHAGGERDSSGRWLSNEGILIWAIIADLQKSFANDATKSDWLKELGLAA